MSDWTPDQSLYGITTQGEDTPKSSWSPDPIFYNPPTVGGIDKGPDTYHDYADAMYSGLHGLGATGASLMSRATTPEFSKYWMAQAQAQRDKEGEDTQDMSPAAQEAVQASMFSSDWWKHPLRSVALQATQASPTLAAMAVPSMLTSGVGGTIAAGAGSFAAVQAGGAISDFAQVIKETPDDELRKNKDYDRMRQFMSPDDAKAKFVQDRAGPLAAKAGLLGAAAGLVPEVGGMIGASAERGIVGQALRGGIEGGVALGAAGGGTEALTEQAAGQPVDSTKLLQATAGQAVMGATLGAIGRLHRREGGADNLPSSADHGKPISGRGSLDSDAQPGQASSTGSPRQGRKPEGQLKPPGSGKETGTGEAPPTSPVDEAQAAALKATLGVKAQDKSGQVNTSTPPKEGEIQSPVAQPAPPVRSPSVPDMSVEPPKEALATSLPPGAESPPTATPAPANALPEAPSPSTAAVPERPETLQLQQEALAKSQKEAVFYPQGEGYSPSGTKALRDTPGVNVVKWPNKDIMIFRSDGPSELTAKKVRAAVKEGKLNDILSLGPVSREEAVARSSAGEQPVAVVNRTADGTEESATAGTTATAPAQIAALEQTQLTPESTTTVESPQQVIADRQAPASEIKQDIRGILPKQPGKKSPQEKQARLNNHDIANRVYGTYGEGHPDDVRAIDPNMEGGKGARTRLLARVKAAVEQANQEGFKFPGGFRKNVDPTMDHPMASLWLSEARTLSNRYAKEGTDAIKRFLRREEMLKKGDMEGVLQDRINEVREKKEPTHEVKEEAIGETTPGVTTHEVAEIAETDEEKAYQAAHDERERAAEEARIAARRAESEELRKQQVTPREQPKFVVEHKITQERKAEIKAAAATKLAELRAQLKTKKESPVSALITPKEKTEATKEEELGSIVETHDLAGKPVKAQYLTQTTTEKILDAVDTGIYSKSMRPLMDRLVERFKALVPDVPVYLMSDNEMNSMKADRLRENQRYVGGYNNVADHTLLNAELPEASVTHVIMHETFHAATANGLHNNPHLRNLAGRLFNEAAEAYRHIFGSAFNAPKELKYALTSPEEMLTELSSNPVLMDALKRSTISPELAKDLDMPRWRKATLFQGALDLFRKILGLSPREYNVIEAALNIGERAMWEREPADEYGFRLRASQVRAEDLRDSPISAMISPRGYSKSMDRVTDTLKDRVRDISPAARTATAKLRNLIDTPRDWMVRAQENNWGLARPAETIVDRMGQLGADREKIVKLSTPVMDRLARLNNENGNEFNRLAKLFVSSTIHGADARDNIGIGKNDHIKINKKGIEFSALEHKDAIIGNPKDRLEYKSLSGDTQQLYNDTMDELSKMNKKTIADTREAFVDKLKKELDFQSLSKEYRGVIEKIINKQDLTDDEEKKYAKDDTVKDLRNYNAMEKRADRTAYFPLHREDTTHVVTGEHDYSMPATGKRYNGDADNPDYHRIVFNDRKSAYHFDPDLPTDINTVHYQEDVSGKRQYTTTDESGGKERPLTAKDAIATPGVKYGQEYHVTVNNRDVRFVNGNVEGEKVRRQMQEAGMKNVSAVQPRKEREVWQFGVHSGQVSSIIKRLSKMDLTTPERVRMEEAIRHVAAASMPGSRLSKQFLQRDRTGGAGRDIIQTLDRYRRNAAGLQAMAKHRNDIDAALEEMNKYVDKNAGHEDAGAMRQMVSMYNDRINNFQKDSLSDINVNKHWNFVRSYTTLMDLVSPAFFFLHQLHIPLTVLPDLAAREGLGRAARITLGVYRDMASKEGPMAVMAMGRAVKSAWQYDHKPTDFIEALKNEAKISGDEKSMIDWLVSRDYMHATGIDFSQAYAGAGLLDKAASKSRNFAQEFIGSADAFNRFNSALMYYRIAKENGLSGEAAYKYAGEGIARTQGQYSSFQRMGLFRDPRMRAVLQYKQYPILMAKTIAKAMYNSITPGVEWETRARALRTIGLMTLSASAMSGVQGGTAYPIRMADDLLSLMGVGDGWAAHMDTLRRGLAEEFSPEGATALMDGVGGLAGIYTGHRGGISDPLGINYLMETSRGDQDMYKWLAGPPGGLAHNLITGVGSLMQGDLEGGVKNLLPRVVTDPIKGYQEYNQGVTTQKGRIISPPVSAPEAVMKALGLTTIEETHAREARAAVGRERSQQQTDHQRILKLWQSGSKSEALAAIQQFNKTYPGQHLSAGSIAQASMKPTVLGYPESARNRKDLEQRARDYGIQ